MARILLSNDDGVDAPGLLALADALAEVGELWIVAPDRDRSGSGHAITVREDLHVWPCTLAGRWPCFAVSGTPADCVKLGILELCGGPPDLVVSGINAGANLGIDVFYSGTVAAALEGMLLGVPSVAISSITDKTAPDFTAAQRLAPVLVSWLLRRHRGPVLLNVNVPEGVRTPEGAVRWTRLGLSRRYQDGFAPADPDAAPAAGDGMAEHARRFRLVGDADDGDREDPATDVGAVHRGWVSVTPIRLDLTDYGMLQRLGARPGDAVGAWGGAAAGPHKPPVADSDGRAAC